MWPWAGKNALWAIIVGRIVPPIMRYEKQAAPGMAVPPGKHVVDSDNPPAHGRVNVLPDYTTVVNKSRRYIEVSDSFCKLLGYTREELIGRKYDDFTAPRTNDIPVVLELFIATGYMHGLWVLVHRTGTKILVRYESWIRPDGTYQCCMELLGAGA